MARFYAKSMARDLSSSTEKSTATRKPFPWERYNQTRIDNEYRKKTSKVYSERMSKRSSEVYPEYQRSPHGEDLFDKTKKYMSTDMQRMEAYLADEVDENDEANIVGDTYERFTDGHKPLLNKDNYAEKFVDDISRKERKDYHLKNPASLIIEEKKKEFSKRQKRKFDYVDPQRLRDLVTLGFSIYKIAVMLRTNPDSIKNAGQQYLTDKEKERLYKPPKTERRILKKMGKRRKPITDKMVKVLVMRVEEYTLKEIAEEMGISIRGVRNIRQRMKDRGMEVP